MRLELFQPEPESEARLLILIDEFTRPTRPLEGRTKLAKLDFFLRYPRYLQRALTIRDSEISRDIPRDAVKLTPPDIESRMVRYRYGPWDPSYFAVLGRLIGKGLIEPAAYAHGIGFRTTDTGSTLADQLTKEETWRETTERIVLLRRYLDLSGTTLKKFIYEHFPEVTQSSWGERL